MEEEFTFDVKIDQGLSGKKSCTIIVSLKDGTLRFCKAGDLNGTKFGHHQVRGREGRREGGRGNFRELLGIRAGVTSFPVTRKIFFFLSA